MKKECCKNCYYGYFRSSFEVGRAGYPGYMIECHREKREDYKNAQDVCEHYRRK